MARRQTERAVLALVLGPKARRPRLITHRETRDRKVVSVLNRVLARLKELDPGVSVVFEPLPAGSSLTVVAMASRQLAAYYEDELGPTKGFGRGYGFAVDPRMFREFWDKSAREFEDLGEFIRESIDEWLKRKKENNGETGGAEGNKTTSL